MDLHMAIFIDQLERKIELRDVPRRIVSLCPSLTETLYALGLDKEVVGRTRFCIHPGDRVKQAVRVGGTKEIKFDRLHQLQPDLIIAEKEENTREMVAELDQHYPVWVANVKDESSALEMILSLGKLTGKTKEGTALTNRIVASWKDLPQITQSSKALYFIWQNPIMSVGAGTFIDAVLGRLGFENILSSLGKDRYPTLEPSEIAGLNPDYILLSSEPYPFEEKHIAYFQSLCPHAKVMCVDGEMFSWYGSRMELAAPYFIDLLQMLSPS